MNKRRVAWVLGIAMIATLGSTGCVSKKMFRKNVEETDQRVSGVESGVETNEKRITDLSTETDKKISDVNSKAEKAVEIGNTAINKADSAQQTADKAMKGKLLWSVTLSNDNVKFSFDQASVPDDAKAVLDDLATKVKSMDRAVYIEVQGHTDNIGSPEYNMQLGEERAMAVRRYLNEQDGIPLHAISVISYGETKPVADNGTPDGRAKNRRVVIQVLE